MKPKERETEARTIDWGLLSEEEKISRFNVVLARYRETDAPLLQIVSPRLVIPDATNRGNTGLSLAHAHHIACKMRDEGFMPRMGNGATATGHDLPIVVRETIESVNGRESASKWKAQIRHKTFAPFDDNANAFYTSLGNGHFFAALNLFRVGATCLFDNSQYVTGNDIHLTRAVRTGVQSVVLRGDLPRRERRFMSEVLNSAFTYAWDVGENHVRITHAAKSVESERNISPFEALSKSLDSFELESLVAQHRGLLKKRGKDSRL